MRRGWRTVTGAVVVLAFLLAGWWVDDVTASLEERAYRPHREEVGLGEPGALLFADIEVSDVDGSSTVLAQTGEHMLASGLWVTATFSVTPSIEPATVSWAELRDTADRSYPALRRNVLRCMSSNPGIPVDCSVAIELPADRAVGAVLVLAEDQGADEQLWVDLGITEDEVAQWSEREDSIVLGQVGPAGAAGAW